MINLVAIFFAMLSILCASEGWPHGGNEHVMGTVTAIDVAHMEVKTPEGRSVSINLTDKTEYSSKNALPTPKPHIGDRVVIDVEKDENGLKALGMEFSTPREKPKSAK